MMFEKYLLSSSSYGVLVYMILTSSVKCDIYLHNPRGSNNRLDEQTRERTNGNNNFDSQNNDRGGYNVGSLLYYQGSILSIEWTNQHSCHGPNNNCELILQYMCDSDVRDGVTTTTIPANRAQCENYNCDMDRRYRMHENYAYYQECSLRERNKGLFTADQNLKNQNSARSTRQNPQATRRGYECPEERDYYPYWHPSPWVDIAVLTNDVSRCYYYRNESQNVKSRWACVFPPAVMELINNKLVLPNNKNACETFELPKNIDSEIRKPVWKEFPAHGVPAPECRETEYSRDNHLGNGYGGHPLMYNWTIPNYLEHESCVLRIRYNISTNDYSPWNTYAADNGKIQLAPTLGFNNETQASSRGYIFKTNPEVNIFPGTGINLSLRLAINTAQYGRVFQDRSHTFAVRKRPDDLTDCNIYNLNVRGKRGNIVQVYPGVEYDFVPNDLNMGVGECVHIQWTGSNTNPGNNDGQGLAGTDRNNIVLLGHQPFSDGVQRSGIYGHYSLNLPMRAENMTFLGWSKEDAMTLAFSDPGQFRGEVSELDDAGTYFNLQPRKVTAKGTYHYMSTRNNNFSNRDQKGKITVSSDSFAARAIGKMGGTLTLEPGLAKLVVQEDTFGTLQNVRIVKMSVEDGKAALSAANRELTQGDSYASDFFVIHPEELISEEGKSFTLELKLNDDSSGVEVYHAVQFSGWSKVNADIGSGVAKLQATRGGVYVARKETNVGMIVGIVIACIVVVAIIVASVIYFRRNPKKWQAIGKTCRAAKRSTQSKV
ncbi:protein DD3-3-like isoform X2 [Biomphalaria glabrata]|nr:protein DD3-3-like isoform X2 [Biomphalaria glabrata]